MKFIKKFFVFTLVLAMVLQVSALAAPVSAEASNLKTGTATKTAAVYKSNTSSSKKIATIPEDHVVTITKSTANYYKVSAKVNNKKVSGYVKKSKLKVKSYTTGSDVIAYAKKFLGNPYVSGGTSLTHGADCSGYIMSVYKHFGYSLPHSSYSMRSCGTRVSSLSAAKPGDIICYSGHVAMYMGNGKMIHAANPSKGICTSTYIHYSTILTIRRIIK